MAARRLCARVARDLRPVDSDRRERPDRRRWSAALRRHTAPHGPVLCDRELFRVHDLAFHRAGAHRVAGSFRRRARATFGTVTRPLATVSVDVDPVDLHLLGYGVGGLPPDPLAYDTALPRLVELFARTGIHATFFVVGRDAAAYAAALRALED